MPYAVPVTPAAEGQDEDLKWVEENIPSASIRDTAFPTNPLDSDEVSFSLSFLSVSVLQRLSVLSLSHTPLSLLLPHTNCP